MRDIVNYIAGKSAKAGSSRYGDIFDPNTGKVQARVQLTGAMELAAAVEAAKAAQPAWAATNPQRRARVMFEFKRLLEANLDELAKMLSSEHGKVIADSKGDIQRGLEVIEFACGVPHLLKANTPPAPVRASTSIRCACRSASSPASRRSTSRR